MTDEGAPDYARVASVLVGIALRITQGHDNEEEQDAHGRVLPGLDGGTGCRRVLDRGADGQARAYATLHDLGPVTVVQDPGLSGKNLERPGLQQLLEMVGQGHVAHVLVEARPPLP